MTTAEAIEIVAQHVVAHLAACAEEEWGMWPEVGEHDWNAVLDRVALKAPYPDQDDFDAAYSHLEDRAENDL